MIVKYFGVVIILKIIICIDLMYSQIDSAQINYRGELNILSGHKGNVLSVTFSPCGKYIATGSADNTAKLWEVNTGKEVRTYNGHDNSVYSVSFSPDGKYIATGGVDNTVKLWEVNTGKEVRTFMGHDRSVYSVTFSPDGKYIATGSYDHTAKLWEVDKGREVRTFKGHMDWIYSVMFSPDGKYLATGSTDHTAKIWDVNTGRHVQIFKGHMDWILSVTFSPYGKYIATGSHDNTAKLWEVDTGSEVQTFIGHGRSVISVSFSPDGRYLFTGSSDNTAKLWELGTGGEVWTFKGHAKSILSVTFSPNGKYLATGSEDNTARIWINPFPPIANEEYNRHLSVKEEIKILEENFSIIVRERLAPFISGLRSPRGEFETTEVYNKRIADADRLENEWRSRIEGELNDNIDSLKTVAKSLHNEWVNALNKDWDIAIIIGKYNPDNRLLEVVLPYTSETMEVFVSLERAPAVVPALRVTMPKASASFRVIENDQIAVQRLIIEDPTGGPDLVYEHGEPVQPTVVHPPRLIVSDPVFTDTDGDNRLSAGERALISFTISNEGQGAARGVSVRGNTGASISGLSSYIGDIQPSESRSISMTAIGGSDIQDGEARIEITVTESGGFDPAPIRLTVPTRAYRPPQLAIADVGISDETGRGIIEPGSVIEITARIVNTGEGAAEDVFFEVTAGENVFIDGRERGTHRRQIGTIEPGSYRDITFEAFCNTRAESFPLLATIRESEGEYGITNHDLGLELHTRQRTTRELIVEARDLPDSREREVPSLAISIERDIPISEHPNQDAVAVIIGNRTYRGDTPDVAFALRDASLTRRYVEQALGYRPGNILYLEDATLTDMRVLFGDDRSPQGRLSELVKEDQSDVFVYYSGHGAPDPNTKAGYLMPVDGDANRLALTGYPLEVLYENLGKLGARSVTVVIDACFSGATGAGDMLIAQASPIGIEIRNPAVRIPNGTIITASTGSQIASWHPVKRHGLLTYFFLKGIQGEADYNADGKITVGELRRYLSDTMNGLPYYARRLHGREQTPQVWGEEGMVVR